MTACATPPNGAGGTIMGCEVVWMTLVTGVVRPSVLAPDTPEGHSAAAAAASRDRRAQMTKRMAVITGSPEGRGAS